jgi:5-methylthioadenosine/S-adenosylhomocysteine deaminase
MPNTPAIPKTAAMPKSPIELLIDARWVLPIAPVNDVREHASVAVSGGRILAVGPREPMHARFAAAEIVSLPNHVLLPGLVNAHGHAAMTLLRGLAEDAPVAEWLNDHVWPLEGRLVDEAFVRDGTRLAVAEMIRGGITCFSDMYFFPEVAAEVARLAGMRVQVAFPIIPFPNAWSGSVDEALHKGMALHDYYRDHPLVRVAFGPHAAYSVSRGDLERVLMYSEELDAAVHIHLHESAAEVAEARAAQGRSWIEMLAEIGLLGPRLQAVHVTRVDEREIALLAEARVQVVHCPHANLKLASGICPVTQLQRAGVDVALGTDGAAGNNALDLFAEARLAALLAKLSTDDARALPAARALEMATLGGARALGLDTEIGSLEPGKLADLTAVDLRAPRFAPVHDPIAALVHSNAGRAVSHVWVAGRALLANGTLTTLDEAAVIETASDWVARAAHPNPMRRA